MFSIPVYIINCGNEFRRYTKCVNQLRDYFETIHRFPAMSPERTKEQAFTLLTYTAYSNIELSLRDENVLPTWGAAACAWSHMSLWKYILAKTSFPYVFIVEDDFEIVSPCKFIYKFHEMLRWFEMNETNRLLRSHDRAKLICQFDGEKIGHNFLLNNKRQTKIDNINKLIHEYIQVVDIKTINMHGYLINRDACEWLLYYIVPIKYQLDIELSLLSHKWIENLTYYHLNCTDAGTRQCPTYISQTQYYYLKEKELNEILKYRLPEDCIDRIYNYLPKKNHLIAKSYRYIPFTSNFP